MGFRVYGSVGALAKVKTYSIDVVVFFTNKTLLRRIELMNCLGLGPTGASLQ